MRQRGERISHRHNLTIMTTFIIHIWQNTGTQILHVSNYAYIFTGVNLNMCDAKKYKGNIGVFSPGAWTPQEEAPSEAPLIDWLFQEVVFTVRDLNINLLGFQCLGPNVDSTQPGLQNFHRRDSHTDMHLWFQHSENWSWRSMSRMPTWVT